MSNFVLQEHEFECGYACVCSILRMNGHEVFIEDLRAKYGHCGREVTVPRLLEILNDHGLSAEACRVEIEELAGAQGPLIIHWALSHFMVYLGLENGGFRVFDPAEGEKVLSIGELSEGFSGIAIQAMGGLAPDLQNRRSTGVGAKSFRLVDRFRAVKGAPIGLLVLIGVSLLTQIAFLLSPAYVALVVDKALFDLNKSDLLLTAALFVGVVIFQVISGWVRSISLATLSANLVSGWYREAVSRLVGMTAQYFDGEPVGETVARVASLRAVQSVLSMHGAELVVDSIAVLLCIAMLALIAPSLLLIVLATVGLYALVKAMNVNAMIELSSRAIRSGASLTSGIVETVRAGRYLRALGMTEVRRAELGRRLGRMVDSEFAMARRIAFLNTSSQLIFGIEKVVSVGFAAYLAASGHIGVGALFAVVLYREQLALRGGALIDRAFELRVLSSHTRRLQPIYDQQNQAGPANWVKSVQTLEPGQIEIDIDFVHPGTDAQVLHECSIRVGKGETVAIVGPSGCGKSTLAKVICGISQPSRGEVRIGKRHDGKEARVVGVFQDEVFFGGSVADNVAGFARSVDMDRVRWACELSESAPFIDELPAGYYTHVSDGGLTLSAGQRQRIAIARALYADPDILIMDEATSALDVAAEQRIGKGLRGLDCTKIVIAHRPETIGTADRVLEMRSGKIEFERSPTAWRIPSDLKMLQEATINQ